MRKRHAILAAPLLLGAALSAQTFAPSGYVTAFAYAAPEKSLPIDAAGLRGALNGSGTLGDAVSYGLSLEAYGKAFDMAAAKYGGAVKNSWYAPASFEVTYDEETVFACDLKEAWVGFALGDFDLTVGKQLVTWGQADGTNPTDNINPRYVGTRSVSTAAERKMGIPMVNVVYNLPGNAGNVQGIFIPYSVPNRMPYMGSFLSTAEIPLDVSSMEGGVRAIVYPGSLSVSASYLTILDRYPSDIVAYTTQTFGPVTVTTPSALGHNRQHVFGLDAVWLIGGFDLRTEWAYTMTKDFDGTDPYARNPFVTGVVQASRTFIDGTTTLTLSWSPTYIFNFTKPVVSPMIPVNVRPYYYRLYIGQGYEFENMVGLRAQTKLLNETIQPEAMFLTGLSARDWLATLSVGVNIADGWNLKAGANFYGSFRDPSDVEMKFGTFSNDNLIDADSIYLELRFDF
ncbi:MAG TPA: hypothetical protein PKO22_05120 [Treponemataceae bacterium]|nr:hypothetical protein [Treponemataceae bacterium]